MDRKALMEKIKKRLPTKRQVGIFFLIVTVLGTVGVVLVHTSAYKYASKGVHKAAKKIGKSWHTFGYKIEELRNNDVENRRLRVENIRLRQWAEELSYDCRAKDALTETRKISGRLSQETGALVGRVLTSIQYQAPTHLLPDQQYTLGISYFKAREHEKAAVILSFLTGLEDNDRFRTPLNYLLTGVAWYKLEHFKIADEYFAKVLAFPEVTSVLQHHAQARLWRALVAERRSQTGQTQFWLNELLDNHPFSIEAAWINGIEKPEASLLKKKKRKPAREKKKMTKPKAKESHEESQDDHH